MIPGLSRAEPMRVSVNLQRVLVVEEAVAVRKKLLEMLHRAGVSTADVAYAETTEAALAEFQRASPNVVFAELLGDDPKVGLQMVLDMLARDPQVRIVLVTAEDPSGEVVRQAIRAGAFGIVEKPLRHDKVRQILAEIDAEDSGIQRFR